MPESGKPRRVYTLDDLPPEIAAVTFAKTSRSPQPFDEIARGLTEADSSRFHEKWVIGYGHSSVSEHAVLSIAIENISILGAKVVEENRLSSFTEKSTRYQVLDACDYYTPPAFREGPRARVYERAIARLYATYDELMPAALAFAEERYGGSDWSARGVSPKGKACDALRGLLPAAAKTNLGWTVNARSLRHAIVKLGSHPLAEMRELAGELRDVASRRVPTLLRYTEPLDYLRDTERRVMSSFGGPPPAIHGEPGVRLVRHDPEAEEALVAALLFRATGGSYEGALERARALTAADRSTMVERALDGIGEHESPPREFENVVYTFEVVVDFGAYRDIQRHRMTTQTPQRLGCDLGSVVPEDARRAGLAGRMEEALEAAALAHRELAEVDPDEAQYVVPLAYRRRFLLTMNLREAYVFVRLRSRVQGHESYREVARAVKREIERVHPSLGGPIPAEDAGGCAGEAVGEAVRGAEVVATGSGRKEI